jgi:hypothetical protein
VPRAAGASGVLLAAGALVLLGDATLTFVRNLVDGTLPVSFREHALIPEPFLVVGLIVGGPRAHAGELFLGPPEWAA